MKHTALVAAALALATAPAHADEAAGKHAAHERHENFEKIGDSFETLEKQAKKATPDAAIIKQEAALILKMGRQIPLWFPPESAPGKGIKTHAKAEIWTDMTTFNDLQQKFITAAEKLNQTAEAGDMAAIKASVEHTGEACSECHKKFRNETSIFSIFGG